MSNHAAQSPIFITGRFRSGTTLLWNIFDRAGGYRAYYEPCHDNLLAHIRYTNPMRSHRGVDDYWRAYRPLLDELEDRHRPAFGVTRLYLESDQEYASFEKYIRFLIESAAPDRAVFQFNRVDLRLPWLRRTFPDATIIHIHREPRETFASMTRHLLPGVLDNPALANVYDLLEWSVSLGASFPFLIADGDMTLYDRHYYLWKLSLLMGTRHAHHSISFDDDVVGRPGSVIEMLIASGGLRPECRDGAMALIEPVETGRWSLIHGIDWYEEIESRCERTLESLGLNDKFGLKPLQTIRQRHAEAWAAYERPALQRAIDQILLAYSSQRSEVTRLLYEVRMRDGH